LAVENKLFQHDQTSNGNHQRHEKQHLIAGNGRLAPSNPSRRRAAQDNYFWNTDKAYGFIRPDDRYAPDLFFNIKFCKRGFGPEFGLASLFRFCG
jgi:hypothetical protein